MLFNSFEFLVFFPVVTLLYFMLPHAYRWLLLLVASCVFYMFFIPEYILILFFTIVIDYIAGIMIENTTDKKRLFLVISIISNVSILAFFKYFNFFNDSVRDVAETIGWNYGIDNLAIILPIGLSFHTFQAMSYTIEVYRGKQKAERHFGIYSLYVMFYPQLVAGPIERPQNMLHQFHEKHTFNYDAAKSGLILMGWGLIKKVVIADRLATFVNPVFDHPENYTGYNIMLAALFFAFQIYCDFSGYSSIAIGTARVMGFKLMTNFETPYFSKSISEFWSRWHISLSTWFKDYLYIPLGGNRVSIPRWYFNLFIVFIVSGFWHGANWTFIIWGAIHGLLLIIEQLIKRVANNKLPKQTLITTLIRTSICFILVTIAWIFFRAATTTQALLMLNKVFFENTFITGFVKPMLSFSFNKIQYVIPLKYLMMCFGCVAFLQVVEYLNLKYNFRNFFFSLKTNSFLKWSIYFCMVLVFILYGVFNKSSFIYFQF